MLVKKTVVLKHNMNCNLRCKYCYEFNRNGNSYKSDIMSCEQLSYFMEKIAKIFPNSQILWLLHGGEPLMTGVEYFKSFTNELRRIRNLYAVDFRTSVQTNGVALNSSDWISALEENIDLLDERIISVSIDGPKCINDETRVSSTGKSSYKNVIGAISKLRNSSLIFSTITVVGSHNVNKSENLYKFIKDLNPNFCKFIPCYNFDSTGKKELYGIYPSEYANFMCNFFDFWLQDHLKNDKNWLVVDPIATIISKVCKIPVSWCEYRKEKCDNFITLYPDGELWLCDTFDHDSDSRDVAYLGNINLLTDADLKKAFESPCSLCKYDTFIKEQLDLCKKCDIYDYCCSGCLPIHYSMKKKSKKLFSDYCAAKHMLFNHIKEAVSYALPELKDNL